jgi:phosphatidylglycerophosphate synthase
MSSLAATADAPAPVAPGRPAEIEEWSNRRLIHPMSRALVGFLIPTAVTPNAVSVAGAVAAALGACAFVLLDWPASAILGFVCLLSWHVLDGADGDLARRTGRASTNGELVDGICDHLGQAAIYLAFALMLAPSLGLAAYGLALLSGLSRAVQASAYEGRRRNYRRWVYGVGWIRHTLAADDGRLKARLGRAYVALSALVRADDRALEAAMDEAVARGGETAAEARRLYRARMQPLVKRASILSANYRSLAAVISVAVGAPILFVLYELAALNLVLAWLPLAEARANRDIVRALEPLRAR